MGTRTLRYDDLDGTDGAETVEFGLDGKDYEIDLAEENAKNLRDAFGQYVAAARRTGAGTNVSSIRRGRASKPATPTADERAYNKAAREWLIKHRFKVADRGRIPAEALLAYEGRDPKTGAPAANETFPRDDSAEPPVHTEGGNSTGGSEGNNGHAVKLGKATVLNHEDYKAAVREWRKGRGNTTSRGPLSNAERIEFEKDTGYVRAAEAG